jgi:hypothetical protein
MKTASPGLEDSSHLKTLVFRSDGAEPVAGARLHPRPAARRRCRPPHDRRRRARHARPPRSPLPRRTRDHARGYLWQQRVATGLELLTSTGLPVSEIASRAGFRSVYHFSRRVKTTPARRRLSSGAGAGLTTDDPDPASGAPQAKAQFPESTSSASGPRRPSAASTSLDSVEWKASRYPPSDSARAERPRRTGAFAGQRLSPPHRRDA